MFRLSNPSQLGSALVTALLFLATFVSASRLPIKHSHLHSRDNAATAAPGHVTQKGFKTVGYYVNWAIYGRNWPPQNIQSEALTHVLYAFAGINNKTGEAVLTDESADLQKIYDGDVADNKTTNLFGNLKQLYIHKKKNRNLKTLLSIGGWSLRTYFAPALASSQGRKTFARTSVQLLKDLGFDGLDIDWEYPNNTKQAADLVDTCRLFREELDAYSRNLTGHPHFLLTLAVPAGPDHFKWFDLPNLEPYVDFISLMGFDYMGSTFSNFSGHNANLYKSERNPKSTDFSTQDAVDYYLGKDSGYPSEKLMLGMPLYGRSFANTSGPGTRFSPARDGSWENGVWDYKALPLNGSQVYHDNQISASWGYNNRSHYLVSYDDPSIAARKAKYIDDNHMGGAMWWELSGDRPLNSSESLIKTVTDVFATCRGLEQCSNVLDYPYSKYANLRAGMPGQ